MHIPKILGTKLIKYGVVFIYLLLGNVTLINSGREKKV